MSKQDWVVDTQIRRFRRCFPDTELRDEMQEIVEHAMRIGNLTAARDWSFTAGLIAAMRFAEMAMKWHDEALNETHPTT